MKHRKLLAYVLLIAVILSTALEGCSVEKAKSMYLSNLNDGKIQTASIMEVVSGRKLYQIKEEVSVKEVARIFAEQEIIEDIDSQDQVDEEVPYKLTILNDEHEKSFWYFSSDFNRVWEGDGGTPGVVYKVNTPDQIKNFFENSLAALGSVIPKSFSTKDLDLTMVNNIQMTNLHDGTVTRIDDSTDISEVIDYLNFVKGEFPESYSGDPVGSYELSFRNGENVVVSISIGDTNVFTMSPDGSSYSVYYHFSRRTIRDVVSFLSNYDQSPDPVVNEFLEDAENLGLSMTLKVKSSNCVLAELHTDNTQPSGAKFTFSSFTVEKQTDGRWEQLELDSGATDASGEQTEGAAYAESLFWMQALTSGQYRLTMNVRVTLPGESSRTVLLREEFEIY